MGREAVSSGVRSRSWSDVRSGVVLLGAALLAWIPATASAHVAITAGDIAFVGIRTGPSSAYAFVVLSSFHPGEVVGITDRGFRADGTFRGGEGEARWVVTRNVDAGTVVTMSGTDGVRLDPSADQLFAFDGVIAADGTLVGTFVHGLELGGPWQADATSDTTSSLPPALSGFEIALGAHRSCAYTGPITGTKAELVALIGDPVNWTCSDADDPAFPAAFTVILARGEPCAADAECETGICANGVCCNTTCRRDEAFHCATCDFGPGDPRTGTCGPAPTTYLCRLAGGPCDPMDRCDGSSTECPPNALSGPDVACRASRGACDPAEVCSGTDAACPADVIDAPGTVCRASRSACDPEETCTGALACPADVVLADETPCDDGLACTAESSCRDGLCAGVVPSECDDADPCTADACDDAGGRSHAAIAGCCRADAECDDGDACTRDICLADHTCITTAIIGCCRADADCDDGDPCTRDACLDSRCAPAFVCDAGAIDAGPIDGGADAGALRPVGGGCGCVVAPRVPPPSWAWVALLAWSWSRARPSRRRADRGQLRVRRRGRS